MKFKIFFLVSILCASAAAQDSYNNFVSGNKLYSLMTSSSEIEKLQALGYVQAVVDADSDVRAVESSYKIAHAGPVKHACVPAGVTARQIFDVVKKGLESDPANRHLSASLITIFIVANAFPC